jgi:hypothetical protein
MPWKLVTYVAFSNGQKADGFESDIRSQILAILAHGTPRAIPRLTGAAA